jgi:hypothetical protein
LSVVESLRVWRGVCPAPRSALCFLRSALRVTLSATGEACAAERSRVCECGECGEAVPGSPLCALGSQLCALGSEHLSQTLHRSGRASLCAREQPSVRVALVAQSDPASRYTGPDVPRCVLESSRVFLLCSALYGSERPSQPLHRGIN